VRRDCSELLKSSVVQAARQRLLTQAVGRVVEAVFWQDCAVVVGHSEGSIGMGGIKTQRIRCVELAAKLLAVVAGGKESRRAVL
jgi:hypothetical protein